LSKRLEFYPFRLRAPALCNQTTLFLVLALNDASFLALHFCSGSRKGTDLAWRANRKEVAGATQIASKFIDLKGGIHGQRT
jgi:hypothetical protein